MEKMPKSEPFHEFAAQLLTQAPVIDEAVPENCTVSPFYDYQEDRSLKRVVAIAVPVLFSVVVILGFVGNAFVLAIVLGKRTRQVRNSTNLLIANLALADLLFIIFCVPFTASDYVVEVWPFGLVWCKIVQYMVHVCAYSSVYTLVLMSVDRYLAVVHPISSMNLRTQKNTFIAISIQWVITFSANVPLIIAHGLKPEPYECQLRMPCTFQIGVYDEPTFRLAFLGTFFILPVTVISSLYFIMLRKLWRLKVPTGHRSAESNRSKKRVTRMVVAVVVIFALCWSPITFILALRSLDLYPIGKVSIPILITAHVLAYSNVCLNPFIYAAAHPGFRNSFKNLLCCNRLSRSPAHGTDFERTDANGETTGFLRSSSIRMVSRAFGRSGASEKSDTIAASVRLTRADVDNTTNHVDNGSNYADDMKFVGRKQPATRQQSKDSVF